VLGTYFTFFIFLAGLFFEEFHKGFAARRYPHCQGLYGFLYAKLSGKLGFTCK